MSIMFLVAGRADAVAPANTQFARRKIGLPLFVLGIWLLTQPKCWPVGATESLPRLAELCRLLFPGAMLGTVWSLFVLVFCRAARFCAFRCGLSTVQQAAAAVCVQLAVSLAVIEPPGAVAQRLLSFVLGQRPMEQMAGVREASSSCMVPFFMAPLLLQADYTPHPWVMQVSASRRSDKRWIAIHAWVVVAVSVVLYSTMVVTDGKQWAGSMKLGWPTCPRSKVSGRMRDKHLPGCCQAFASDLGPLGSGGTLVVAHFYHLEVGLLTAAFLVIAVAAAAFREARRQGGTMSGGGRSSQRLGGALLVCLPLLLTAGVSVPVYDDFRPSLSNCHASRVHTTTARSVLSASCLPHGTCKAIGQTRQLCGHVARQALSKACCPPLSPCRAAPRARVATQACPALS